MISYTRNEWSHMRRLLVLLEDMSNRYPRHPDRIKHANLCARLKNLLDGDEAASGAAAAAPTLFDRYGSNR